MRAIKYPHKLADTFELDVLPCDNTLGLVCLIDVPGMTTQVRQVVS